jgi:hypothetical protein
MKREFHLVSVVKTVRAGGDGGDQGLREPSQMGESFTDLTLLGGELLLVGEILKPASAAIAGAKVPARGLGPLATRGQALHRAGLGMAGAAPRHTGPHAISRQGAVDKDDQALVVADSLSPQGQALDREFDLLVLAHADRS